jgi:hypothetical protein
MKKDLGKGRPPSAVMDIDMEGAERTLESQLEGGREIARQNI